MSNLDGGFRTYSCPHAKYGTKPCFMGCHEMALEQERIMHPPPKAPPPVTCPACIKTGPKHDHGCEWCGEWECDCRGYREAIEDAANVAHEIGEKAFEQDEAIAAGKIERAIRALLDPEVPA